jgi:hypothetical protein
MFLRRAGTGSLMLIREFALHLTCLCYFSVGIDPNTCSAFFLVFLTLLASGYIVLLCQRQDSTFGLHLASRGVRLAIPSFCHHRLIIDRPCVLAFWTLIKTSLSFIHRSQLQRVKSNFWSPTFDTCFFYRRSCWLLRST